MFAAIFATGDQYQPFLLDFFKLAIFVFFQDRCSGGESSSLLNTAAPSLSLIRLSMEGEIIQPGLFLGLFECSL